MQAPPLLASKSKNRMTRQIMVMKFYHSTASWQPPEYLLGQPRSLFPLKGWSPKPRAFLLLDFELIAVVYPTRHGRDFLQLFGNRLDFLRSQIRLQNVDPPALTQICNAGFES